MVREFRSREPSSLVGDDDLCSGMSTLEERALTMFQEVLRLTRARQNVTAFRAWKDLWTRWQDEREDKRQVLYELVLLHRALERRTRDRDGSLTG